MDRKLKFSISYLMVLSIITGPLTVQKAIANEFDSVCKQALSDARAKKSTEGDQKMGYCVQAEIAKTTKEVEIAKSIIFLAATVTCTTFAVLIATAHAEAVVSFGISEAQIPAYEAACKWVNVGASVAGVGADVAGHFIIKGKKEDYGQAAEKFNAAPMVSTLLGGATTFLMGSTSQVAADAATKGTSQTSIGCIMCAISTGLSGSISVISAKGSADAQNAAVKDAKEAHDDANLATNTFKSSQFNNPNSGGESGSGTSIPASTDSCSNSNGNQYLTCLGGISPEIAAITNSPEFMKEMTKALKGKNLGDFIKGYKEGTDMNSYVAAGLGVNPGLVSHVAKSNDKLLKDSKFMEHYKPMTYARGGSAAKVSNDLDFSKMMAGLMGKMGGDKKDSKEDPSELVFRQMELLPADKIQANKDISLFARIAFRYRKNNGNVEQLNWSRPENQDKPDSQKK